MHPHGGCARAGAPEEVICKEVMCTVQGWAHSGMVARSMHGSLQVKIRPVEIFGVRTVQHLAHKKSSTPIGPP